MRDDLIDLGRAPHGGNPYLEGNFAPVAEERTDEHPLEVEGAIPPALEGMLLRIGPNPAVVPDVGRYHWFSGDGMVHAVELRDGAATSYRNRWVRTRRLAAEIGTRPPRGPREPVNGPANTNIIFHAKRLLALVESGLPHRLSTDLDTVCVEDFNAMLASPMTAHPHRDPVTGGLAFFGYDVFGPPFLRYHEMDASGDVVHTTPIEIPRATMQHDFGVSASKVVFMDLPVVFDSELAATGASLPFRWMEEAGARLGVLDRAAPGSEVRWVGLDPCYVFHVMNAFDEGDDVLLDVCRYEKTFDIGTGGPLGSVSPSLQRWRIRPDANRAEVVQLDDLPIEFPRIDDSLAGLPYRYGYCTELDHSNTIGAATGLVRYDLGRGEAKRYPFAEHLAPGEPVFVRAPDGRADDEGWVLTVVYDATRDASDLIILDASQFAGRPEAVVHLPARVPFGFHGSWVAAVDYR